MVEALARSGVGSFVIVDDDKVCLTNINRQIIATRKTIGKYKVEVMRDRILEINPDAKVEMRQCFYLPENAHEFDFSEYSYVVDAVDIQAISDLPDRDAIDIFSIDAADCLLHIISVRFCIV